MLGGIAAAAVALGAAQLAAIPLGAQADARTAVGSTVIDLTPNPIRDWLLQTLGSGGKLFLSVTVLIAIAAVAAIAGSLETPRRPVGSLIFVLAGALGAAAVLSRSGTAPLDALPAAVGAVCGVLTLRFLVRRFWPDASDDPGVVRDEPNAGRRATLVTLGLLTVGAASGVVGSMVGRWTSSVAGDRSAFTVPRPATPAPPIPAAVTPDGVALPRFVTPATDFFRVDTALAVPQLRRDDWQLRIHGMVDREIVYEFDDLTAFDVVDAVVTLTCVSNPVGGDLISTGVWTGYRIADLLARSGIRPDADMVLSTSVDGFTAGTPVEALTDGRDALLAVGLNGEPLPLEHGYPARLVVPGLYGYVSATKWVVDLEVTRFDRAQAYWTRQGWAPRAPIKTQSRIDVPRPGQQVPVGPVTFGGVAWAQNRGVRAVKVRIDHGPWRPAELGAPYSNETWRLWSFPWQAERPGTHTITVRATDNTGAVQTAQRVGTVPDGATGWHTVDFTVTGD
ncbi:molybdopterin-dependent oxidoreductase [Mycolicibacterium thermoresistibile]